METWPNNVKTAEQAFRQPDDLLGAWLAALNQFDPMPRQAAKCRQGSGSIQIAPQPIRRASAKIPPIFNRAYLVEYPLRGLECEPDDHTRSPSEEV
jgi:hypothetical protein